MIFGFFCILKRRLFDEICVALRADSSMLEFLQYQDQTSQYYSDLMAKLELMNSTLGSMLHYIDNMQGRVEERLHIIQGYLGWAGKARSCLPWKRSDGF